MTTCQCLDGAITIPVEFLVSLVQKPAGIAVGTQWSGFLTT